MAYQKRFLKSSLRIWANFPCQKLTRISKYQKNFWIFCVSWFFLATWVNCKVFQHRKWIAEIWGKLHKKSRIIWSIFTPLMNFQKIVFFSKIAILASFDHFFRIKVSLNNLKLAAVLTLHVKHLHKRICANWITFTIPKVLQKWWFGNLFNHVSSVII